MRRLDWTVRARADLRQIDHYLTREADVDTAVRTLRAIRARTSFLLDFPGGGPALRGDQRSLRVTGTAYILVYRVLAADRVEILRICHERQNRRGMDPGP